MFVRFWKKDQVDATLFTMKLQFGVEPKVDPHGLIEVFAPDGDLVFVAIPKDDINYIVRLHEEVFNQD